MTVLIYKREIALIDEIRIPEIRHPRFGEPHQHREVGKSGHSLVCLERNTRTVRERAYFYCGANIDAFVHD